MRPENGGFLFNRFKIQSVTASAQKTGYEIEKAFNKFATEVFICPTNTLTAKMTLMEPCNVTGFALIYHNLTQAATILLSYFSDSNFSTLLEEKSITYAATNTYITYNDAPNTQYIQLDINDPNITEIQIGIVYPGQSYQFPYNYKFGLETEFHVVKQIDTTDEGIHFETPDEDDNVTAPEYHRYRMTFGDLDHKYFHEYCELIKPGKKVYILKFTEMECYYGIVPDQTLKKVTTRGEDTYSLRFFEDALPGGSQ